MEDDSRLSSLQHQLVAHTETEVKLKRLCTAITKAAVAERARQLGILSKAKAYVADIQQDAPRTLSSKLKAVANEVNSLYDGVKTESISQSDFTLSTGFKLVEQVEQLRAGYERKIEAITADSVDTAQHLLEKLGKYKQKLPDLSKKDFGFARMPVVFTFQNKAGHSSVGFTSQDLLSHLGFKSEVLDGYAVIYDQVVLGLSKDILYDFEEEIDIENNEVKKIAKPKYIKERVSKFTGGKPGMVVKKRPKNLLDFAEEYRKMLSEKTGINYSMVSEHSHPYHGTSYFWLMPSRDLSRFAKAFPGGHVKFSSWGFAFN